MSRPWHLRPVGAAAGLWAVAGVGDYLLAQLRVPAYLSLFAPDQIAYFTGFPTWVQGLWAVAVWAGLLGAVLLLLAVRGAALALGVAALAMAVFSVWLVALSVPPMQAVTGGAGVALILGTSVVQALLWLYARALHATGALP